MMPGEGPISIYRGDTKTIDLLLTMEDAQGNDVPVDFTDHTFLSQIREDVDSPIVLGEFDVEYVEPGHLKLEMDSAITENINVAKARWDIQSTDPDGYVQTWIKGEVTVLYDVSRYEE